MTRARFSTGSAYEPVIGCSRAVRHGNVLSISATAPLARDGAFIRVVGFARPEWHVEIEAECHRDLED